MVIAVNPFDRGGPPRAAAGPSVVVAFVPPPAARARSDDQSLSAEQEAVAESAAPLRVAGFDFDVARIRERRNTLFPF